MAAEGDLARHRSVRARAASAQQRDERHEHRYPRRRPVLRRRRRGEVHVQVGRLEQVCARRRAVEAEARGVRADPRERRAHGLPHHLADLAREDELAATPHLSGFDEEQLAAHRRPREPHRHARPRQPPRSLMLKLGRAEDRLQVARPHGGHWPLVPPRLWQPHCLHRHRAAHCRDHSLEPADPRLASVPLGERGDCLVRQSECARRQAVAP
mmetsp:Transcript_13096/g.32686  ORF Transcript_13096/g.32686 Transcript_13096/m.32686 type:complete len:212 (-) Transcript_13096:1700-2335(-)